MKLAVIYWSGTGNTEAMAEYVAAGAKAAGAEAEIFRTDEFSVEKINGYDGFALGCPAMGAEELEESEFAPLYEQLKPGLAGKKVVLFGSYGWEMVNGCVPGRKTVSKQASLLRQNP